jgi:hypothetical protein
MRNGGSEAACLFMARQAAQAKPHYINMCTKRQRINNLTIFFLDKVFNVCLSYVTWLTPSVISEFLHQQKKEKNHAKPEDCPGDFGLQQKRGQNELRCA